ncbi:MAG: class I SAM-dependent methyltransferase [Phycisphaerales bacterium]|nr:class I SAM-dependent methyltransferase [Phycisphaerales bacterium]
MSLGWSATAERAKIDDVSDNFFMQKSIATYRLISSKIKGVDATVLEVGTGTGYSIDILSPHIKKLITVDQYESDTLNTKRETIKNFEFIKMSVPPLVGLADESFDFIVCNHLIEHIDNDSAMIKEMHRVLKKKGILFIVTPNKLMSVTRNIWHVREYTVTEFEKLLTPFFCRLEKLGIFGNDKITEYYEVNKAHVKKITRFDIFNLQYRLPRWLLKIPYDVMNKFSKLTLMKTNSSVVSNIVPTDYYFDQANDRAYDLFYIATKS